jgi:hypothetical protein
LIEDKPGWLIGDWVKFYQSPITNQQITQLNQEILLVQQDVPDDDFAHLSAIKRTRNGFG